MASIIRRTSRNRCRWIFALSIVFVYGFSISANAEVHVEGSLAAVRVTTSRDAISDVLSALAVTFKVQYRTAIPLDAAADATYSGSFRQVLSRLLDGYNYVIKANDAKTTEIVIFGKRGEVTVPPKAIPDKPEVASAQSKPDKLSANAMGLCMSMGGVKFGREPSKKRVISRTYTCTGDLAKDLKLALDRETKETLESLVRRYAPGGARVKIIEYECPTIDRCTVTVKY